MNPDAMAVEDQFEATHWWFEGRRRLFRRVIQQLRVPASSEVLDIGCGTGGNLRLLREFGFSGIAGADISPQAVQYCRLKGFDRVEVGAVEDLPFPSDSFGLGLLTDVLEHVEDDVSALVEVRRVLRPGGSLIVTVPAFMGLWGPQDEVSHHLRRYTAPEIREVIEASGLRVEKAFYFNYILAGPILLARRALTLSKVRITSENSLTPGPLNWILKWVFAADVISAARLRPPFGVSILVLCRRPD